MENRKNILLIGFNGNIGSQAAISMIKNHNVYCLMRSGPKMGINSIFLRFIDGDADNLQDLKSALQQKDVVVSAYGSNQKNAISEYTAKLIAAMKQSNVKRLIIVGSSGALIQQTNNKPYVQSNQYPQQLKQKSNDHINALKQILQSELDYTVVCPHKVINQQSQNNAKVIQKVQKNMRNVHASSIGKWVNQEILQNKWNKKVIGLID